MGLAIDVLSRSGGMILDYTWEFLKRDIANWNAFSDRAYKPNDDYWYVLLRACAKTVSPEADRLRLVVWCMKAQYRGIREGAVEALRDIGTPRAKKLLSMFLEDKDNLVRRLAREAMEEMES
jgi:hypothetical protein